MIKKCLLEADPWAGAQQPPSPDHCLSTSHSLQDILQPRHYAQRKSTFLFSLLLWITTGIQTLHLLESSNPVLQRLKFQNVKGLQAGKNNNKKKRYHSILFDPSFAFNSACCSGTGTTQKTHNWQHHLALWPPGIQNLNRESLRGFHNFSYFSIVLWFAGFGVFFFFLEWKNHNWKRPENCSHI